MQKHAEKSVITRQAGPFETFVCNHWLGSLFAFALTICAVSAEPQFATDSMSDSELRAFRNQMRNDLRRLLETAPTEVTADGKAYRVYDWYALLHAARVGFHRRTRL